MAEDTVPRKPHREICSRCHEVSRVSFYVPPEVWELATHASERENGICLACFARLADERGVEWDRDITFVPMSWVASQRGHEGILPSVRFVRAASSGETHPDTRRLEWLEREKAGAHHSGLEAYPDDSDEPWIVSADDERGIIRSGKTLRAAIDAAILAQAKRSATPEPDSVQPSADRAQQKEGEE